MKPIVHTISGAASPYGIHSYLAYLDCPKAAAEKERRLKENGGVYIQEPLTWSGAAVGTVGHALMEMHFSQALPPEVEPLIGARIRTAALQHSDLMEERVWVEAVRCFRAFREYSPQLDLIGQPVHVEEQFGAEDIEDLTDMANFEMSRAVGLEGSMPYTMRLDMAGRMTKAHVERFLKLFPQTAGARDALEPGTWLVDWKFYGRQEADLIDKSLVRHQYTAYTQAYNAWASKQKRMPQCKGTIQFTIFRRKVVEFLPIIIPLPTRHQIRSLHQLLRHAANVRCGEHFAIPTESNCLGRWGSQCILRKEGLCRGYDE